MTSGFSAPVTDLITLGSPSTTSWTAAYDSVLSSSGYGSVSRGVIAADADYIVQRGILAPEAAGWPESRARTGVVVGAVQSGKTSSMMAVAARLLDHGPVVLVILAGTRTALWQQTYERVRTQLDTLESSLARRTLRPTAAPEGPMDLSTLYSLKHAQARRSLAKDRPIVFVAMKQVDHLERVGRVLHDVIYPAAEALSKSVHLVVIDDEADDSSIDDLGGGLDDDLTSRKQVPRRIVDLWESRDRIGETTAEHVFATYVAYTATPQANFIQDSDNPLSPRDFVVALRTPGSHGQTEVRTPTYKEPSGLHSWYTGGDIFYRRLRSAPLSVTAGSTEGDDPDGGGAEDEEDFVDPVRAFLIATAVRLWRAPTRLGPLSARRTTFDSEAQARGRTMAPASMLVHPSAMKDDHFALAERILVWSAGGHLRAGNASGGPTRFLSTHGLERDMIDNEPRWTRWLDSYRDTSAALADDLDVSVHHPVPESGEWEAVRRLILEEVAPGTAISVVNSDAAADDRPRFQPVNVANQWTAAPNLSTIFVAGNVMSRGLTLEGLTTTLFTRAALLPLADSQMQMQRWFGFRGPFVELCRVFVTDEQLELFRTYHEHDEALRRDILARMDEDGGVPDVTILQGSGFRATGKVSNVHGIDLSPGHRPFLRYMNPPGQDTGNLELVRSVFDRPERDIIEVPGGLLLRESISLVEVADLLDSLRYPQHQPGRSGSEAARWRSLENHLGMGPSDPLFPLYRPPGESKDVGIVLGRRSPYHVAAYLRLWSASLYRNVDGLFTTDQPARRWSTLNLEVVARQHPRFWIGLRFGSGEPLTDGPLATLRTAVRPMARAHEGSWLSAAWGARNTVDGVIRGDEVFDYGARGVDPDLDVNDHRRRGSDGMLLFHVIDRKDGVGAIAVGLGIPVGGPDQIEARRSSS